jgi:hypothetical protein
VFQLWGKVGSWLNLAGPEVSFSGGALDGLITSAILGIVASAADSATVGEYHFGIPQFVDVPLPNVPADATYQLDLGEVLPPTPTPWGNVVVPNLTAAETEPGSNAVKLTIANSNPDRFVGKLVLRALFDNGSSLDVQTFAGDTQGVVTVTPPENLAIGSLRWQLVRLISTAELDGSGTFSDSDPLEFAGNVLRISPPPQMAATLTRTGVEFLRQNSNVSEINRVDILGKGYDFAGTRLTGGKVQPIVFADDLSRAYVAGKGAVHVIDTLSFKPVGTIAVPAGKNIVSLATVGSLLFIGEGDRFAGGAPYRLLAVDINPGSARFNQVVTLKGTGIESTDYGVSGMAIGPDGETLVVGTPISPNSTNLASPDQRGSVWVFDLSTLDMDTGKIAKPVVASLPDDGRSGKSPQSITATKDADRFLVANVMDTDKGLSTLKITRDNDGNDYRRQADGDQPFPADGPDSCRPPEHPARPERRARRTGWGRVRDRLRRQLRLQRPLLPRHV